MSATAVVTVASAGRADHLARQRRFLAALHPDLADGPIGWLDGDPPSDVSGTLVPVPPGVDGLRVAAGRNAAAAAAIDGGADLLIFLDADCLPGAALVDAYERAAARHPGAVLAGAVTYLTADERPSVPSDLPGLTRPHPARPAPPPGEEVVASVDAYDLFWSLSFAIPVGVWHALGGFDEGYEGYGAEDTDFARRMAAARVPLVWAGGADAYHQWHPVESPPWGHLDDILRNGARYARRWGRWPMTGWLEAFADAGAITWDGTDWHRTA